MDIAHANLDSATTLIEELIAQGVTHFSVAPGNRSAPLAYALSLQKEVTLSIHFDERGAAVWALGVAKASGKAAAVITTSGSAVANLMPAILEAYHSHTPLLVITADRPLELYDVMANQTTNQFGCFGSYASFFTIPTPEAISVEAVRRTALQAVLSTYFPTKGAVHLNCPYKEPLFSSTYTVQEKKEPLSVLSPTFHISQEKLLPYLPHFLSTEGALLVGGLSLAEARALVPLAKKLGWPIFADPLSCYRHQEDPHLIWHYGSLLKALPHLRVKTLIHVGDRIVSKPLSQWIASHQNTPMIHLASHARRCDPSHVVTHRIISDLPLLFQTLTKLLPDQKEEAQSLHPFLAASIELRAAFASYFTQKSSLSEPSLFYHLPKHLPETTALFLGNSMPIRHADAFFYQVKNPLALFGNRGLSGIDGNLATCSGIAEKSSLVALVGDQTFLHDLNSLKLIKEAPHPIKLIVINNGGGAIFSFTTPSAVKEQNPQLLSRFFTAPHSYDCRAAAELFHLPYAKIEAKDSLFALLAKEESMLIEIPSVAQTTLAIYQELEKLSLEVLTSSCV